MRLVPLPALVLPLLMLTVPAAGAQEAGPHEPPPADEGGDAFALNLDDLMQNLLRRAQPSLDGLSRDLEGLAMRFGPVLGELGALMDDAGNYQAPERLENGDILIRRRADAPPPPPIGPNLRELMRPAPQLPSPEPVPPPPPEAEIEL